MKICVVYGAYRPEIQTLLLIVYVEFPSLN